MIHHFNSINILLGVLSWLLIGLIAIRFYRKHPEKLKAWKVVLVLLLGLFSFTININGFGSIIRLPILPLGVWILYILLLKNKNSWRKYRSFAWIGFFANFVFLFISFVQIPIEHLVYPSDKPTTYLANVNNASLIITHPSGKKGLLNKKSLIKQLPNMQEKKFYSAQWYEETYLSDKSKNKERFPYELIGIDPKWGSGLSSVIYIERNGKGILIGTAKRQYYFHFKDSIIKWEGEKQ
ncbi:MAG: hypothetical protein ACO1OT_12520 [Heyndrickxia sp.]